MGSKNIVEIVIKATDDASKKLGGLHSAIGKLGLVAGVAGAAVVAAGVVIAKTAFNLAKESAQVEKLRNTFDQLAKSIGENSDVMIKDLRVASRGMLNDADLMQASNKLVAMGLADTSEESSKLVEMSTQLGTAMGMTATDAAEAFALMLANQSIPRLDNFGISSGKVRDRIEELMAADSSLTREQAFMNAVMEEGAKTMEKVGEQGTGAAADMARLQAKVDNLKVAVGDRLRPVLETIVTKLLDAWDNPVVQAGIERLFDWITKVVGDENSGIIGVITALADGDIGGALEKAFGNEPAGKVGILSGFIQALGIDIWALAAIIAKKPLQPMQDAAAELINRIFPRLRSEIETFKIKWINSVNTIISYINNLISAINRIPFVNIPAMSNITTSGSVDRGWGRASGGPVSAGGSYLVGERGPEMLTMGGSSGYITPMGGVTVHLHVNSAVSLSDMANAERVLLPIVERGLRTVMAR